MKFIALICAIFLAGCVEDAPALEPEPGEAEAPNVDFQKQGKVVTVLKADADVGWRDVTVYFSPAGNCGYELFTKRGNSQSTTTHANVNRDIESGDRLTFQSGCTGMRVYHKASASDLYKTEF